MALITLETAERVSGASVIFTIDDVTLTLISLEVQAVSKLVIITVFRNNGTVLFSRQFQPREIISVPMTVLNRRVTARIVTMHVGVVETKYDWPHRVEFI